MTDGCLANVIAKFIKVFATQPSQRGRAFQEKTVVRVLQTGVDNDECV